MTIIDDKEAKAEVVIENISIEEGEELEDFFEALEIDETYCNHWLLYESEELQSKIFCLGVVDKDIIDDNQRRILWFGEVNSDNEKNIKQYNGGIVSLRYIKDRVLRPVSGEKEIFSYEDFLESVVTSFADVDGSRISSYLELANNLINQERDYYDSSRFFVDDKIYFKKDIIRIFD